MSPDGTFECDECGRHHDEMPAAYQLDFPSASYDRTMLRFENDGELCAVGEDRFILANIELPFEENPSRKFAWTCWFSLSQASYDRLKSSWDSIDRERQQPAFAYLANSLPTYSPTTLALKALVHVRPFGQRPWVELEPTENPLAQEQATGIALKRMTEIFHGFLNFRSRTDEDAGGRFSEELV